MKRRHIAIPLLIIAVGLAVVVQLASKQIVSPSRARLTDYHYEILAEAEAHGMILTEGQGADGTPYLLCRPDSRLSPKGRLLRQQLRRRGLQQLPPTESTLLILHGHGGRKEDSLPIAERFCAAGYNCLLPDLPGHGNHPTKVSTFGIHEVPLLLDLCREELPKHQLPPQVSLLGFSQGGAIALQMAALPQSEVTFLSVTAISTFGDLAETVAQTARQSRVLAILFPLVTCNLSLQYGFNLCEVSPREAARQIQIPALIVHGGRDKLAAVDDGRAIFDNLATPIKRLIVVPEAGHGDVLLKGDELYATMAEFLLTKTHRGMPPQSEMVGSQGVEP